MGCIDEEEVRHTGTIDGRGRPMPSASLSTPTLRYVCVSTTAVVSAGTLFGKITSDVATASLNGEPLMNLMLRLTW